MIDHRLFVDCGIAPILPYVRILSTETLITALYGWASSSSEERAVVEQELVRRMGRAVRVRE